MQYENSQLTGSTLYFVQLDAATGNGWNGSAYVTYTSTRSTFARPLTEISGTGLWQGTVGGTARYHRFLIYLQSGGSPSFVDDVKIAEARYYWDGTTLMPQGPVVEVRHQSNSEGGRVWWLDDGGNDSNDGFSLSTAKLTPAAVITAAADGDTIRVGGGTILATAPITTAKRLNWEGNRSTSIIRTDSDIDLFKPGNGSIIKNLRFVNNSTELGAKAIDLTSRHFITFENVIIDSAEAVPMLLDNSTEITLCRVQATTTGSSHAIYIYGDQGETGVLESSVRTEGCRFYGVKSGAYVEDRSRLYDNGSEFKGQYAGTSGALVAAIMCDTHTFQGPRLHLIGSKLVAIASNAGFSGDVCGVSSWRDGADTAIIRGFVDGGSVELVNAGSGDTFDFDIHNAGSLLVVRGCAHDRVRNHGDYLQVIDKDVADTLHDTESVQSYLPATGPIASASQIDILEAAVQPQKFRDAMKLAPTVGAPALNSIDDKIDDIEGGGGGVTIPVIQVPVPSSRTWILKQTGDGLRGELPIVRSVGENQVFAIEWRHDLGNNGRLISLDSISFTGPENGIAIEDDDRGVDRSACKFRLEAFLPGTYVINTQVTFDDSDGGGQSIGSVMLIVKS